MTESRPVLILAPTGRDAEGIAMLLGRQRITGRVCLAIDELRDAIDDETGAVIIAEEAIALTDLRPLRRWLEAQPPWSDLPFIVLTQNAAPMSRRHHLELRLAESIGNVMFLERPLSVLALSSAVRSALRARDRQYQVRAHLIEAERAQETLERRVAEATEEIARTQAALAQAQKMEAVGQLVSGIAHDFNNLLTAVIGNIELLKSIGSGRACRYIDRAAQAAERGAKLTQQLLAFSRASVLDLRPIPINAVLQGMRDLLTSSLSAGIEIAFELDPEVRHAHADANQLELAIINLAVNARDAMPGGGRLTVATSLIEIAPGEGRLQPGTYVSIAVTDTGAGMPPGVVERALEPFFTTKEVGRGSGLGLSQVYGISRQCGGDVRIASKVGRGTTVSILLPEARSPPARAEDGERPSVGLADVAAVEGTVLVIDDDPLVRQWLVDCLGELGYEVHEAPDGRAAIAALERIRPDVLLIDYAMPGMSGVEVARAARTVLPQVSLLFATGYADFVALDDAPVLRKPFQMNELARTLKSVIAGDTARLH